MNDIDYLIAITKTVDKEKVLIFQNPQGIVVQRWRDLSTETGKIYDFFFIIMGYMLPVVWNSTKLSGAGKWLDVKNLMCRLQREDETAGQVLISNGYQWSEIPFLWRSFCRSLEGVLVQILRTIIRTRQTNKQKSRQLVTNPSEHSVS